jgi:hypothetical protein
MFYRIAVIIKRAVPTTALSETYALNTRVVCAAFVSTGTLRDEHV